MIPQKHIRVVTPKHFRQLTELNDTIVDEPQECANTQAALTLRSEETERMAEAHRITLPQGGMSNLYSVREDHVVIFLQRRGKDPLECLVDIEDFPRVAAYPGTWGPLSVKNQKYYAIGSWFRGGKRVPGQAVLMHRMILGAPKYLNVDHVEQSQTLDNRRSNLRLATVGQNSLNRENTKIEFRRDHWLPSIKVFGKLHRLGVFSTMAEAEAVRLGASLLADSIIAASIDVPSLAEHKIEHHPQALVRGHK